MLPVVVCSRETFDCGQLVWLPSGCGFSGKFVEKHADRRLAIRFQGSLWEFLPGPRPSVTPLHSGQRGCLRAIARRRRRSWAAPHLKRTARSSHDSSSAVWARGRMEAQRKVQCSHPAHHSSVPKSSYTWSLRSNGSTHGMRCDALCLARPALIQSAQHATGNKLAALGSK
jgi:hypothetical protein